MFTDLLVEEQTEQQTEHQTTPTVRRLRISRSMYSEMIEASVIPEGSHVQLIDGELFQMPAMENPHWIAIGRLLHFLEGRLPAGWMPVSWGPIVTDEFGEPEPDLAICRGSILAVTEKATARETGLAIEVSDSTLAFDRRTKQRAYAEAGIPEYWIINLVDRVIEVYTNPKPRDDKSRGKYAAIREYRADEKVAIRLEHEKIVEFTVGDLFI